MATDVEFKLGGQKYKLKVGAETISEAVATHGEERVLEAINARVRGGAKAVLGAALKKNKTPKEAAALAVKYRLGTRTTLSDAEKLARKLAKLGPDGRAEFARIQAAATATE